MMHLAAFLIIFLFPLAGALCPPSFCPSEPCGRCAPRPRQPWAVGLAHWYGENDGYAWRTMANGQPFDPGKFTVAMRVDLLPDFPLGSLIRATSACGVVTATVTDAMPLHPEQPQVIVDVSPAIAGCLFCGGYGWDEGVAYGEELVLIEAGDDSQQ